MIESKDILYILVYISHVTILLPTILCIVHYRRLGPALQVISHWVFATGVLTIFHVVLAEMGIYNLFLLNIYTVMEFVLLCFYFNRLSANVLPKKHLVRLSVIFTLLALTEYFKLDNPTFLNSWTRLVEAFVILILVYRYLRESLKENSLVRSHQDPHFWLACGFVIYFVGTLLLFPIFNFLQEGSTSEFHKVWSFHTFSNILLNLFVALSIWTKWKWNTKKYQRFL